MRVFEIKHDYNVEILAQFKFEGFYVQIKSFTQSKTQDDVLKSKKWRLVTLTSVLWSQRKDL